MLFRAQVRDTAIDLIQAAVAAAGGTVSNSTSVAESKDTPIPSGTGRKIIVYTDDMKEGVSITPPTFRTHVLTTVEITAEDRTDEGAEDLCEALCELVECTLLGSPAFVRLFEMIVSMETQITQKGVESRKHVYAAVMEIKGYATEIFEPRIETDFAGAKIYVDSRSVFDANGEYQPPFDYPVPDAPRTSGPDGRIEIAGSIEIPQE